MNKSKEISTVSFHTVTSTGGTTLTLPFSPSGFGGRFAAVADGFTLFRIVKARFRLHVNLGTQAMCFEPGIQDTPPATTLAICDSPNARYIGAGQTVPSDWSVIPPSLLRGPLEWYKSINGVASSWEECPGQFYGASAAVNTYEIEWTAQFKGGVAIGSTPEMRAKRVQEQERGRLLSILASDTRLGPLLTAFQNVSTSNPPESETLPQSKLKKQC